MMKLAIETAKESGNEIPVGAVIVRGKEVISIANNQREDKNDITGHAEIEAIRKASEVLGSWRLDECEMYVTLEPCPMCAWAILQSRIKRLYFGTYNPKYGAFGSVINLSEYNEHKIKIFGGIEEEACDKLLETFWKDKRRKN